jgi:hypothetical protein
VSLIRYPTSGTAGAKESVSMLCGPESDVVAIPTLSGRTGDVQEVGDERAEPTTLLEGLGGSASG